MFAIATIFYKKGQNFYSSSEKKAEKVHEPMVHEI